MHYRPDIDGLRALAVLSVIGFHATSGLVPGGYVGVDIFFVISGFLITSIICRNLENGDFSLIDFYARRAKRIFPSLIVVLSAAWLFGWAFLLRQEFEQLGKHMAAGAGFISNFALWQESGYFDKAAASKPLLHLWSLGIEEQFYILWPPLLAWAWRRKAKLLGLVLTIIAISFGLSVLLVNSWEAGTLFYLPATRFWELLLGGALAYAQFKRMDILPKSFPFQDIVATAGMILLLTALLGLNSETVYPGWWALLPTSGALLLISAGEKAWINRRLLSNTPAVFIGIISYPLYLWHWPLLSYVHILESDHPSGTMRLAAVALSFLLAWLTYRVVEKPIRAQSNYAALIVAPVLVLVGCLGVASFFNRFHARSEAYGLEKIAEAAGKWDFPGPRLKLVHSEFGYYLERAGVAPKVLFLGDSNVQQYYPRIDRLLSDRPGTTKGVVFVTQPACPPIPYVENVIRPQCKGQMEKVLSVVKNADADTVVIAAAWWAYPAFNDPRYSDNGFGALASVIQDYRKMGRQVYLILPIPIGKDFDPYRLIVRSLSDFSFGIRRTQVAQAKVVAELQPITSRLLEIAKNTGATPIDPVGYLCREGACPTLMDDGSPVYKDATHLSPSYVREHATFLDTIVTATDR
jgi:peptidoglycan/LPS O-acetylase OafA/YrhL